MGSKGFEEMMGLSLSCGNLFGSFVRGCKAFDFDFIVIVLMKFFVSFIFLGLRISCPGEKAGV